MKVAEIDEMNVNLHKAQMCPFTPYETSGKEVPVVFLDVVKLIPPDDGGPVHLQLGHHTGEDTATDGHLI